MEATMTKPEVNRQGKAVVERDGDWFLVMFPDGSIERLKDKRTVERRVKSWFYIHNDPTKIGVGLIEWRL